MKTIIKIILFALMLVLIGCNDNLKVQGFNNANHGNVIYVAKTGNNATAQLGNPDRPFADPWAAVAAIPDSGWLVQFLDAGTYTFGPTGSGADFESPTTRNLEFNLAKNGVKMDMNHAVLKYVETEAMDSLVGAIFYSKNLTFQIVQGSVDMSSIDDTVRSDNIGLITIDSNSKFVGHFDKVLSPTDLDIYHLYVVLGYKSDSIPNAECFLNIDELSGGSPRMGMVGETAHLSVGVADCVYLLINSIKNVSYTLGKHSVDIKALYGRFHVSTLGSEMSVNIGLWDFRKVPDGYDYHYPFAISSRGIAGKEGKVVVNVGVMSMTYTGYLGSISEGDTAIVAPLLEYHSNSTGNAILNVGLGYYTGSANNPCIAKYSEGTLKIAGKIISNKAMRFNGGKVDISGLTFVTTDTTSTRATAATTVLCNGFRSNKAMSSVNTTKVGTEFINASVF